MKIKSITLFLFLLFLKAAPDPEAKLNTLLHCIHCAMRIKDL